jgi:very-short-patch-repair endonuclease
MAQQGQEIRVGACEGFACHSAKLVVLDDGNRHDVECDYNFYKW